jgi:aspartate beta-hydroxylase
MPGVGSVVRISGLKARPDLNETIGTIVGPLRSDSGRMPVLVGDEPLLLKPDNVHELRAENKLAASIAKSGQRSAVTRQGTGALWERGRALWEQAVRETSAKDLTEAVRLLVVSVDSKERAPTAVAQSRRCLFVGYCRSDALATDEAITYLGMAISLDPSNVYAWRELLLTYESDAKDLEAARALVTCAIAGRVNPAGWSTCWQRPGTMVPGLEARPFWDAEPFQWVARLEAFSSTVCAELEDALSRAAWPKVGGEHRSIGRSDGDVVVGDWREMVLLGEGATPGVAPQTVDFLEREVPACVALCREGGGEVIFSRLEPGAMIKPHCAPTNLRLTAHLGLKVPSGAGCRIRVGREWRGWKQGKVLLFDDSFEHEVENLGTAEARVVLLIRFFHPGLMSATAEVRRAAVVQAVDDKLAAVRARFECPP